MAGAVVGRVTGAEVAAGRLAPAGVGVRNTVAGNAAVGVAATRTGVLPVPLAGAVLLLDARVGAGAVTRGGGVGVGGSTGAVRRGRAGAAAGATDRCSGCGSSGTVGNN